MTTRAAAESRLVRCWCRPPALVILAMLGLGIATANAQPGQPTLIGPSGPGQSANPTYEWNEVAGATDYYLYVVRFGVFFLDAVYSSSVCTGSPVVCSVTPATTHTLGEYSWVVVALEGATPGPASDTFVFNVGYPPANPVTVLAPAGGGIGSSPTYSWTAEPDATGYALFVVDSVAALEYTETFSDAGAICSTECSVTPSHTLADGIYATVIVPFNASGNGPESDPLLFRVGAPLDAPTLVSPSETFVFSTPTASPTYTWLPVSGAIAYVVVVYDFEELAAPLHVGLAGAATYCLGATCDYTPAWPLSEGLYLWYVAAVEYVGPGPISDPPFWFGVATDVPAAPVATAPVGTMTTTNPLYEWEEAWGASEYDVKVEDGSGVVFEETYPAGSVCDSGECAVNETVLPGGAYTWSVRGSNPLGDGPWSNVPAFTVPSSLVAAGHSHSMVVTWNGGNWAWGANGSGQIGDGSSTDRLVPVELTDTNIADLQSIALGQSHTVVVTDGGDVYAWGSNAVGQLGRAGGDSASPVFIDSGFAQVAAGAEHTVALDTSGNVWAWGSNLFGQVGLSGVTERDTPAQVSGLSGIQAVAAGAHHSYALASDGSIWAWGRNHLGQLGDGTTVSRHTPAKVTDLTPTAITGFVAIAAGPSANHALAIQGDATVWAWGANSFGQIGDGSYQNALNPVQVSSLANALRVSAGERHSLAVLEDGSVQSWGDNSRNQLGDGGLTSESPTPIAVTALMDIAYVASGQYHNLALDNQGLLYAWGDNLRGQLGNGTTNPVSSPSLVSEPAFSWLVATPTITPSGGAFFDTVTATLDTLTTSATLYFTTDGSEPDTGSSSVSPGGMVPVSGPATLKVKGFDAALAPSVTVEADFGFVAKKPGAVPAGGYFTSAQQVELTTGTAGATIYYTLNGSEPTPASTQYTSEITVSSSATLKARAYLADWSPSPLMKEDYVVDLTGLVAPTFDPPGGTYVTSKTVVMTSSPGDAIYYTTDGSKPTTASTSVSSGGDVDVDGALRLRAFAASGGDEGLEASADYRITGAITAGENQTFLVRNDGTAWGVGINLQGRLGGGTSSSEQHTFLQVDTTNGLSDIQQIAFASEHGLAVDGEGDVWSWGPNTNGELGNGTTTAEESPIFVSALDSPNIVAVAAGDSHSLALDDQGQVWGWGASSYSGLGAVSFTPQQITSLSDVKQIAAAELFSYALDEDGTLLSWGNNTFGQLGRTPDAMNPANEPGAVAGIDEVIQVELGDSHVLALRSDGTVWAWGWNASGQLGDGTTTDHSAPAIVANLADVRSIATGDYSSYAVRNDGVLLAWGNDVEPQIGGGMDRYIPGPVGGVVQDVIAVDGGYNHTVVLGADGRVWAFGSNAWGQLGVEDPGILWLTLPEELSSSPLPIADGSWLSDDLDGDGLSNADEIDAGTDLSNPDTNGDGLRDGAAHASGVSATLNDVDGDGISNEDERAAGIDPFHEDTDGDGFSDDLDAFPLDPTRQVLTPYDPNDATPPAITLEEPESATLVSSDP